MQIDTAKSINQRICILQPHETRVSESGKATNANGILGSEEFKTIASIPSPASATATKAAKTASRTIDAFIELANSARIDAPRGRTGV